MIIPVLGMDPSLTNWGLAKGNLSLITGELTDVTGLVIEPKSIDSKQVRVNSNDLHRAEQLAEIVLKFARAAKAIFVEVPVGSQSARAMASYGICVGILAVIRAEGIPLIEVTALESKKALSGNRNATKKEMIEAAMDLYPDAKWYVERGRVLNKNEHIADGFGAIHAGVNTPVFKNLMRLYEKV